MKEPEKSRQRGSASLDSGLRERHVQVFDPSRSTSDGSSEVLPNLRRSTRIRKPVTNFRSEELGGGVRASCTDAIACVVSRVSATASRNTHLCLVCVFGIFQQARVRSVSVSFSERWSSHRISVAHQESASWTVGSRKSCLPACTGYQSSGASSTIEPVMAVLRYTCATYQLWCCLSKRR